MTIAQSQLLRPQDHPHPLAFGACFGRAGPGQQFMAIVETHAETIILLTDDRTGQDVRVTKEASDEAGPRLVVDLLGRTHLLDHALAHHDDLVGHRQGLGLIMGHEHGRDTEFALNALEFDPHLLAQIGIERGQRLIQQQHIRTDHDGTRQRDALLLATRQLIRKAVARIGQLDEFQRLPDPPFDLVL